jgi:uroporphyrinogen-III synthase
VTQRLALGPSTAAALQEAVLPAEVCPGTSTDDVLAALLQAWRARLATTTSPT